MEKIGMFEAKTHLPEIVKRVQEGGDICVTNRNKEVAYIMSVSKYNERKNESKYKYSRFNDIKKRSPLGDVSEILKMRDEGKK
jgi:prevent-host-death family protein